jgi:hypothetical protein
MTDAPDAKRKKGAFTFEGKIDLTKWDFNRLDWQDRDAISEFQSSIEKFFEEKTDELFEALRNDEDRVLKIASEAVQIAIEDEIYVNFWHLTERPEVLTIHLNDLSADGYEVEVNLKEQIRDELLERCDPKDGYILPEYEKSLIGFADMLDGLVNEIRTAIRPGAQRD